MILKRLAVISKSSGECKNEQIISAAIKLLKDNDYRVRYGAVTALLAIGEKGDSLLIGELRGLLNDPSKLVKNIAVKALAKLDNSSKSAK
jgi:HEAT repeat protein